MRKKTARIITGLGIGMAIGAVSGAVTGSMTHKRSKTAAKAMKSVENMIDTIQGIM